jgi:TonB-dependent receptor
MANKYQFSTLFIAVLTLAFTLSASLVYAQQYTSISGAQNTHFFSPLNGSASIQENSEIAGLSPGSASKVNTDPQQQGPGEVAGTIVDASTKEPLIGASIQLRGTAIGSVTNTEGEYLITRMPAGDQVLVVRYLGYVTTEIQVTVVSGQRVTLDISLRSDHVLGEEIVIYTQALGQANAIRQQLNANTIVNVVSEARLRELPDANAAESVGRLPGVSVLRDAGEGQKVAIRGLGPQYSSITIDGNRVPGTDGDRSVDLSMISPEMLSGIEVYKSLRPDIDADAIGGSVNFRMGGVPSQTLYRFNLESGYSTHITGIGNYKASFSGSSRFLNNRLGVMITGNAQNIDRSSHVLGASYDIIRDAREGEPHAPVEVRTLNLFDLDGSRERYGGGISMDWKLPNGRIFTNHVYSRQNRRDVEFQRRYSLGGNNQFLWIRDTRREIYTINNTLAGEHDWRWLGVEWRFSRSASSSDQPFNHFVRFQERNAMNLLGADLSGGPQVIPSLAFNRLDDMHMYALSNSDRGESQENIAVSLDFTIPYVISSQVSGYVKFGGKHYNMNRDRLTTGYEIPAPGRLFNYENTTFPWVISSAGRALIAPFLTDKNKETTYTILNGAYEMTYKPSVDIINQLWYDYSHRYLLRLGTRFEDYDATERLSAGYIMTEMNIGPRLMILPGVRYEYEHSEYLAKIGEFFTNPDNLTEDQFEELTDSTASRNMGMWFPMVQARYRMTNWFDIRAARTVSTARPSFGNVAPRYRINYDSASIRRGNTQIRSMRSTNYDLFLTFHHNRLGLFTLGGFYKEVEDLIYTRNANVIFPEEMGLPVNTRLFQINEPVNNENLTTVHGFEIEWQSNLIWLPSPFNGLVINANFSRFFSEAHYHSFEFRRTMEGIIGVDTFRVAPMIHQADYIANVSLGYDFRGFSSRVSMQYQGATLRGVGNRPEADLYTDDYLRFDASIRQRFFNRRMSLFANLNNVTNRPDRSSQFTYDRPRNIEYYGATFDIGMEFRF